jgi:hypothetical protein
MRNDRRRTFRSDIFSSAVSRLSPPLLYVLYVFPLLHSHAQLSTENLRETSCQENGLGILSPQIEPGGLKNFAAQLKEGARAARFMRPRFFLPPRFPLSIPFLFAVRNRAGNFSVGLTAMRQDVEITVQPARNMVRSQLSPCNAMHIRSKISQELKPAPPAFLLNSSVLKIRDLAAKLRMTRSLVLVRFAL